MKSLNLQHLSQTSDELEFPTVHKVMLRGIIYSVLLNAKRKTKNDTPCLCLSPFPCTMPAMCCQRPCVGPKISDLDGMSNWACNFFTITAADTKDTLSSDAHTVLLLHFGTLTAWIPSSVLVFIIDVAVMVAVSSIFSQITESRLTEK